MKRWMCLWLAMMIMMGCGAQAGEMKDMARTLTLVKAEAMPEQDWQKTAAFPDWKGYTDDTLAMNSMLSFQGFHGQGTLWLEVAEGVESFALYVNGVKCDTSEAGPGVFFVDFAGAAADGVNTIQVSNILPLGLTESVKAYIPYPEVLDADRGLEGIDAESVKLISDIIEADVARGFSGAQLAVVKNGRLVVNRAWGRVNGDDPDSAPVTTDTLYDLASVTKMFTVNYAVQKLATDGALDIDAPIVDILGAGFADDTLDIAYEDAEVPVDHATQVAWKRELTVRDVLRHQAGFPAGPHYNDPYYDMAKLAKGKRRGNPCYATTREDTLKAICKTPLLYEPGTKTMYSDVDYMLLCFVVEKVAGQRIDAYMRETFFGPLGFDHITFLPLENGFAPEDCAATELHGNTRDWHIRFPGIRTRLVQGEVHDERAWYCMEGVSGHAGLFSNAADLAKLASVMLTGGYGGHRFFSRNVIDLFTAPKALDFGQWGLGWWRQGDDQRVWYFGTQAASNTVGHQGWTGTLAMIDPARSLVVVYLTNKINSRVLDDPSLNKFAGGCYTASTLGFVPQLLSIGMDEDRDTSEQLKDLVADMAAECLRLIPEGAGEEDPCVQNALSKLDVLRAWTAEDPARAAFADAVEAALTVGKQ